MISHHDGLCVLVGNFGNAFINNNTKEKVYMLSCPEFDDREGCIIILCKALYGLMTSGEQWHAHFEYFLHLLDCVYDCQPPCFK